MLLFQFILFHCTINKIRGNRRKFHNVIEKGCFIVFCCHICFQTFSIIVINRNIIFQICINGSGLSLFMKEHFWILSIYNFKAIIPSVYFFYHYEYHHKFKIKTQGRFFITFFSLYLYFIISILEQQMKFY